MYSPTTRVLTVLELLQSYKHMQGSEIARRLEVNPRTVRRYIVMLQDMGIPVEAERGPHGAYQLRRGYKLPPLMFTDAEAIALTLGLLAMRELRFPVDAAAVEGALAKTERVMPDALLRQMRALQEAITFKMFMPAVEPSNEVVMRLSSAAREHQRTRLRYQAWDGSETEREFDPYGIVFHEGYWYTSGYCHLRQDLRTFRLDRVIDVTAGSGSFERPTGFDTLTHVLSSIASMPGAHQVEVLLETTLDHARNVIPLLAGRLEATPDGVLFRRQAQELEWIAWFLLDLDFPLRVLQPPQLREMLRGIAAKIRYMVGDEVG